jgi:hypothetical protein
MKGAIVSVEDAGGAFRTRAEVRHILIGADGEPRLELVFLDGSAPTRLLTDAEGEGQQEVLRSDSPSTRRYASPE